MPTGYTAAVADGKITDLEPFIWQLARGMGALIMMRDDPWDAPVPEKFEPSQYSADRLVEARAERDRIRSMSAAEADAAAKSEAEKHDQSEAKYRADKIAQRERYQAMIDKVEAWESAPEGIKEFGLEQLRTGMKFDCPAEITFWDERPSEDGQEWRLGKLQKIERDIAYHAKGQGEEDARTEGRNSWLAHLRKSLADHVANPRTADCTHGHENIFDCVECRPF